MPPDGHDPDRTRDLPEGPAAYDAASLVGTRLGDYELLRELGRGGMGVVYEARQVSLNRRVALKLLPPGLGLTETAVRRFHNEAQAAARLHHSNIVPVYATGRESGHYYYAMELVDGQPWDEVLADLREPCANPLFNAALERLATRKGRTAAELVSGNSVGDAGTTPSASTRQWFDAVATLLADVADGLHFAHETGVIHRDIKPSNLLLARDGRLCVTDFGLARMADEPALTLSGSLLGTPSYMAPEQIAAGRITVDRRADVYSLGAVLYETLTLRRPFEGEARDEILTGIMTREPRPPRRTNPRVPVDLETICLKALEKDPARRYQTAADLAADLRAFLRRGLITARRPSPWRRTTKFVRRHPVATTVVMAVLVLLGSTGALVQANRERAREDAVRRALAEARYLQREGENAQSLARLDEVLARVPDHAEALLLRARLLLETGRGLEAVAIAERVLAADPDAWVAHMIMVMAIRAGVLRVPAAEHLAAVERLAPDSAESLYLRAVVEPEYADQLPLLERALAQEPGLAAAVEARAECHLGLRDFAAARRDAERLAAIRPRAAAGPCMLGRIQQELHDYEGALAWFARAVEREPDSVPTYFYRCLVHSRRGNYDLAVADIERALAFQPDSPWMLQARAMAHFNMGRYDEAIADAERALAVQPDYVAAYWPLGYATGARGDQAATLALVPRMQRAIAELPEPLVRAESYAELAAGLADYGVHPLALAAIGQALALDPHHAPYLLVRAKIHKSMGDAEAMGADCERAAALPLDDVDELLERAETLDWPCGLRERALADCDRVIERAPQWADGYLRRGRIRRAAGDRRGGEEDLRRAAALAPQWSLPYLYLARACEDEDRDGEALSLYAEFFARDDKIDVRWDRARLLLRLGREEEAFADIAHVQSLLPERSNGYRYEAWAHSRLGRLPAALAAMDSAVARDPSWGVYLDRARYRALTPGLCDGAREDLAAMAAELPSLNPWRLRDMANVELDWMAAGHPDRVDLEQAERWMTRAHAHGEENWSLTLGMGKLRCRQGRHAEAQEILDLAAAQQDGDPGYVTCFYQALNLAALGRPDEAREWYARGVARAASPHPRRLLAAFLREQAAAALGLASP